MIDIIELELTQPQINTLKRDLRQLNEVSPAAIITCLVHQYQREIAEMHEAAQPAAQECLRKETGMSEAEYSKFCDWQASNKRLLKAAILKTLNNM